MWPTKEEIIEKMVRTVTNANLIDDISDSYFVKHMINAAAEVSYAGVYEPNGKARNGGSPGRPR
jgi:mannitol/fructose-specific phosphotransferase system IIA component (Ntr-type)